LSELNERLKQNGYVRHFPPEGIELVSWCILMGIGQVRTLRVPAARLPDVNRANAETARGGYRTDFYPERPVVEPFAIGRRSWASRTLHGATAALAMLGRRPASPTR
jgi:hypothetical protein